MSYSLIKHDLTGFPTVCNHDLSVEKTMEYFKAHYFSPWTTLFENEEVAYETIIKSFNKFVSDYELELDSFIKYFGLFQLSIQYNLALCFNAPFLIENILNTIEEIETKTDEKLMTDVNLLLFSIKVADFPSYMLRFSSFKEFNLTPSQHDDLLPSIIETIDELIEILKPYCGIDHVEDSYITLHVGEFKLNKTSIEETSKGIADLFIHFFLQDLSEFLIDIDVLNEMGQPTFNEIEVDTHDITEFVIESTKESILRLLKIDKQELLKLLEQIGGYILRCLSKDLFDISYGEDMDNEEDQE